MIDIPKGVCLGSRDVLEFWEINSDISETVHDIVIVATDH